MKKRSSWHLEGFTKFGKCAFGVVAMVGACAMAANAATYYWKPGTTLSDYGTLSNWSTEGLSGADATALPGSGDALYYAGDYAFDLGGNTYEIGGWSASSDSGARRTFSIANGTLDNKGDWKPYKMTMTIGNGGTFVHSGGSFLPGQDSTSITYVNVESGGTFTLTGACNPMNLYFNIASGGTFNFNPSYWGLPNKACASGIQFNNNGTLNMVNGMSLGNGAASGGAITVSQLAGTLNLAGTLDGAPPAGKRTAVSLSFSFSGGIVNVTGNTTFANCAAVKLAGPTTWNVASGKAVSFSGSVTSFGFDATAFSAGDTVLTTSDATLRAKVLADLTALGISVEESGNNIVYSGGSVVPVVPETSQTFTLANLGSSSSPVEFSDPANWTWNGDTAPIHPRAIDTILFGTGNSQTWAHLALDGDYTVANFTQQFNIPCLYKSPDASAETVSLTFAGTIGGGAYQYYYANAGTKLIFAAGSNLRGATSDWSESRAYASQTGEIRVLGSFTSRHMNWYVSDSAKLYFAPTSYAQTSDTGRIDDNFSITGGSIVFPNGLAVTGGNSSFNNTIAQSGGTVTFGGDFTSANSPWTYTFSGGTLETTANCAFGGSVALVIPASANVTLDVASGTTFSAANFSADSTASIVKDGGGTFAFAPTTAPITVNEGAIGLSSASAYDLSNVSLGEGASASIALIALGARVDSLPAALAGATFTADLSSAAAGTVVFYSADSTILARVKTDISSSVPAGFELVASGEVLSLEVVSAYVFSASGNLISDTNNWSSSSLPGANAEVAISGAGVVAEYTGGTIPAWASIEVKDGATLKISAGCALPPIALNKNATLEIASGSTFLTNGLSGVVLVNGDNVTLPVLSVASDATLNVPGGMKFKNVDIHLNGTLTRTSSGNLVFGHAENGETSYIGFHANAAKITNYITWSYGTSICICCPDAGGSVRAVGSLGFKDMPTSGTHLPESGDNYWNGLMIGENNPSSIPVEVVFDNTKWSASGISKIAGAATFRLKNGSRFANKEHDNLWGRRFDISESGKVVLEDDSELCIYAMGDWGSRVANIQSAVSGGVAVEASGDSRVEFYRTSGNNNAVMSFSNSIYRIYRPSIYHDNNGTIYDSKNEPFKGLKSVTLAEGSTLTFSTCNGYYFNDNSGDRIVSLADVPITGGGSLALSNNNVNVFGVIVKNGANGATGTASVMEPASGKGAATLYFASGANWAGTVVAGNVVLTNLTDAAAASTVSFGTLDLAAKFDVRVWKDGSTITSDTLNVGSYANHGGRLTPRMMSDGQAFELGDIVEIGKIRKGADLPRCARNWTAETRPIEGDDENDRLVVVKGTGMQFILR